MSTRALLFVYSTLFYWFPIHTSAQDFVNNDLDGIVGGGFSLPFDWQVVAFDDPACLANMLGGATPDVTGPDGPVVDNGIMGNPYSGNTFVSGLRGAAPDQINMIWDEGIQQEVDGFSIGQDYMIGFYQTVVKQINVDFLDTSGSWAVYVDTTLIGVSIPTSSQELWNSINLPWEFRSIPFTATSTSHVIKFLPRDDDTQQNSPDALRMGIDSIFIYVEQPSNIHVHSLPQPSIYPNPTTGEFTVKTGLVDIEGIEIFDMTGRIVQIERTTSSGLFVVDASSLACGTYFVRVISHGIHSPGSKLLIDRP